MSDKKPRDRQRFYLMNQSCVIVPFFPEDGETNPDPKNQVILKEVMPDEPDYKAELKIQDEANDILTALCEQLMGALAKIRKENEFFSDSGVMDWDNVQEIAFKALEQAKKMMGEK